MKNRVLWKPELKTCSQCGCLRENVREYFGDESKTLMCKKCWKDFTSECNIEAQDWVKEVNNGWEDGVPILVEFEKDGTDEKNNDRQKRNTTDE